MKLIGITSTIPQEIVYAAGYIPCDLNNLFIEHTQPEVLVRKAEAAGFPANCCSWIKGIYTVARQQKLNKLIAVTAGDCSNSKSLTEVLQFEGIETIPFAYPQDRCPQALQQELDSLIDRLGTDLETVQSWKARLDRIRKKLAYFDNLCQTKQFASIDNHLLLVKASDMDQDPGVFEQKLELAIEQLEQAAPLSEIIRIGYIGVPSISPTIYSFIDSIGARVVFNEVQRQFAMPNPTATLVDQYLNFTYPYDINARINDIRQQVINRNLQGLIHYTQSFCHRQIADIVIRKRLRIPILTLEIDKPSPKLDGQTRTRIEGFIESLKYKTVNLASTLG